MKNRTLAVVAVLVLIAGAAQVNAQLRTPVLSPRSTMTQVVGIDEVTIDYSRPSMRGRVIMGELVPYGEIWRTGANAATTLSFGSPAMLDGHKIDAGKYAIYTLPGKDRWTIILSKNTESAANYPEGEDALRFDVKPMKMNETVESFTIDFADLKSNSANIRLRWENTQVSFPLSFDVDAKIMASIEEAMTAMAGDNAQMYFQSAEYYFNNDKDLNKALVWVNESVKLNENAFWAWRLKSRIMASLKDYNGAIKAAEMSKKKAMAANNQQFVQFNEDAIAEWRRKLD